MIEDISSEKRMKSTMSRYMDPGIADQLLEEGADIMGGLDTTATFYFLICEVLQILLSHLERKAL